VSRFRGRGRLLIPVQTPGVITEVQVIGPASMVVGTTAQASASAIQRGNSQLGVDGDQPVTATFTWTSSNEARATVDANGLISAVSTGAVAITATVGGVAGSCSFDVVSPTPTLLSLTISPDAPTLNISTTQQFTASALWDDDSTNVPPLTWDKTAGDGSIDSVGIYTALGTAGTATIRVRDTDTLGISDTTGITISDPGGPVPMLSVDWNNYATKAAVLAASDGTDAFAQILTGYSNKYRTTYIAEFGSDVGAHEDAFDLVADATFGKALVAEQWGRDEFTSLVPVDSGNSCPSPRIQWVLPTVQSLHWSRRYIRLGVATDHPSGIRGWTNVNDGSASYKMLGDEYDRPFQNVAGQPQKSIQCRGIQETNRFMFWNPDQSSPFTETLISSTVWRQSGGSPFNLTWYEVVKYFKRISDYKIYQGIFARKCNYRDGTPLSAPTTSTPASYAALTEGDWRGLVLRYQDVTNTYLAPTGIKRIGWGYNMNGRIDYTQKMFYGPVTVYDGYADPLGLLSRFGVLGSVT
jgi:hypothetical protein